MFTNTVHYVRSYTFHNVIIATNGFSLCYFPLLIFISSLNSSIPSHPYISLQKRSRLNAYTILCSSSVRVVSYTILDPDTASVHRPPHVSFYPHSLLHPGYYRSLVPVSTYTGSPFHLELKPRDHLNNSIHKVNVVSPSIFMQILQLFHLHCSRALFRHILTREGAIVHFCRSHLVIIKEVVAVLPILMLIAIA